MALLINGFHVADSAIQQEIEQLEGAVHRGEVPDPHEGKNPELTRFHIKEMAKEHIVEQVLISQEAENNGPKISQEQVDQAYRDLIKEYGGEKKFLNAMNLDRMQIPQVKHELKQRLRREETIGKVIDALPDVSDERARAFYDEHINQFMQPERVAASHIVYYIDDSQDEETARKKIEAAAERLKQGEDFGTLAEKDSDSPESGGDLGTFTRGQMPAEFEDAAFGIGEGNISDPVKTPYGYHIIHVRHHYPEGPVPFDDIKDPLKEDLLQQDMQEAYRKFIEDLKKNAEIKEV